MDNNYSKTKSEPLARPLHASLVHATSNACLADRHGQIYVRILLAVLTYFGLPKVLFYGPVVVDKRLLANLRDFLKQSFCNMMWTCLKRLPIPIPPQCKYR